MTLVMSPFDPSVFTIDESPSVPKFSEVQFESNTMPSSSHFLAKTSGVHRSNQAALSSSFCY